MIFDLIAAHQPQSAAPAWTPADLFKSGELGFWLDASDWTTVFQDSPATLPITATGQTVGSWFNKIPAQSSGFNIGQGSASLRPTVVGTPGKYAVRFDGVDDILTAGSVTTSISNGFTVAVGQTKTNRQNSTMMAIGGGGNGLLLNNTSGGQARLSVGGTPILNSTNLTSIVQPSVIMAKGRSGSPPNMIRVDGTETTGSSTEILQIVGTLSIVGNATNSCSISQAVFINRILSPAEIALLETFIASKQ